MYFDNCLSIDDARRTYRRLAKIHHPDSSYCTKRIQNGSSKKMTIRFAQFGNTTKPPQSILVILGGD